MKLPKLPIGRWLGKAAKWVWNEVKDDILREIMKELAKELAKQQGTKQNDG